jgi:diguanylate cyclase (GGDEF)-like protein
MTEPALTSTAPEDAAPAPVAPPVRPRRVLGLAALVVASAVACAAACVAMGDLKPVLLIPLIAAVIGLAAMRIRQQHEATVAHLREQLRLVRSGAEPMDSLIDPDRPSGELSQLGRDVQAVLRELRQERQRLSELNDELRQRVANRTDALQRVIGSLRQQASRDPLTGLYNRRVMDRYLAEMVDRCHAEGLDLALLMLDIDNFKPLNDTLGHPAGDQLLRNVGRLIRSTVRDQDVAFRYGGDEFAIILPGGNASAAAALTKRLCSLVEAMTRTLKVPAPPRLSVGMSHLSELPSPTPQELLRRADEKLYAEKRRAKQAGKGEGGPTAPSRPQPRAA